MEVESYLKRDYIQNLAKEKKRSDGRALDELRKLTIERGYVSEKACGSALVTLGDTKVLCGISVAVGEPYSDSPGKGVMAVGAELRPGASPHFETGPPNPTSIELARVVDRGIRESKCIELDKLAIDDEHVWIVFIDLHVLDHQGNMIDAAGLAGITALLDARLPKYEDEKIIWGEYSGKLPVGKIPIPCTTAKIGNVLVMDPSLDEEYALDARLTVTTTDAINAMQKGGGFGTFTEQEILDIVDSSFKKAKGIRKIVEAE